MPSKNRKSLVDSIAKESNPPLSQEALNFINGEIKLEAEPIVENGKDSAVEPEKEKIRQLCVLMPESLYKRFKIYCSQADGKMSRVAAELIEVFLDQAEK